MIIVGWLFVGIAKLVIALVDDALVIAGAKWRDARGTTWWVR